MNKEIELSSSAHKINALTEGIGQFGGNLLDVTDLELIRVHAQNILNLAADMRMDIILQSTPHHKG